MEFSKVIAVLFMLLFETQLTWKEYISSLQKE